MKKNMGTTDRAIRITLALVIALLYFSGFIGGGTAVLLGIVAGAFLLTSAIGWCPVYAPLGLCTIDKKLRH